MPGAGWRPLERQITRLPRAGAHQRVERGHVQRLAQIERFYMLLSLCYSDLAGFSFLFEENE